VHDDIWRPRDLVHVVSDAERFPVDVSERIGLDVTGILTTS